METWRLGSPSSIQHPSFSFEIAFMKSNQLLLSLSTLLFTVISVSYAFAPLAIAQHAQHGGATTTTDNKSYTLDKESLEALYWARLDSAKMNFSEDEVRFMTMMIPHHAQALIMSDLATKNGAGPQVRTLSSRIINAQKDEIRLMQTWLSDRKQPYPAVEVDGLDLVITMTYPEAGHGIDMDASVHSDMAHKGDHDMNHDSKEHADMKHGDDHSDMEHGDDHAEHGEDHEIDHVAHHADENHEEMDHEAHHADENHDEMDHEAHHADENHADMDHDSGSDMASHDMGGHEGHDMMDHSTMVGMLTPDQMKELSEARGIEFDRLFLKYMIQHHNGAVIMVTELFDSDGAGWDDAAYKIASDIQVDQRTEIARMELMLEQISEDKPE